MPYIKIKAYPKDEKIKKQLVDELNATFLKIWGCPQDAISISIEEVDPSNWDDVRKSEILPNKDKMMIIEGEKQY